MSEVERLEKEFMVAEEDAADAARAFADAWREKADKVTYGAACTSHMASCVARYEARIKWQVELSRVKG